MINSSTLLINKSAIPVNAERIATTDKTTTVEPIISSRPGQETLVISTLTSFIKSLIFLNIALLLKQAWQDLNLQPAVLETAALASWSYRPIMPTRIFKPLFLCEWYAFCTTYNIYSLLIYPDFSFYFLPSHNFSSCNPGRLIVLFPT